MNANHNDSVNQQITLMILLGRNMRFQ